MITKPDIFKVKKFLIEDSKFSADLVDYIINSSLKKYEKDSNKSTKQVVNLKLTKQIFERGITNNPDNYPKYLKQYEENRRPGNTFNYGFWFRVNHNDDFNKLYVEWVQENLNK